MFTQISQHSQSCKRSAQRPCFFDLSRKPSSPFSQYARCAHPRCSPDPLIFTDPFSTENSYVLNLGQGRALVIDPNLNDGIIKALGSIGVSEVIIALTHAHLDHICGIPRIKERFPSKIVCSAYCEKYLKEQSGKALSYMRAMLMMRDSRNHTDSLDGFTRNFIPFSARPDLSFVNYFVLRIGARGLRFIPIPGHSPSSCAIIFDDCLVFTGDSLFADRAVITRFPGGNTNDYKTIALPFFLTLPKTMKAYPGHGRPFHLYQGLD